MSNRNVYSLIYALMIVAIVAAVSTCQQRSAHPRPAGWAAARAAAIEKERR